MGTGFSAGVGTAVVGRGVSFAEDSVVFTCTGVVGAEVRFADVVEGCTVV